MRVEESSPTPLPAPAFLCPVHPGRTQTLGSPKQFPPRSESCRLVCTAVVWGKRLHYVHRTRPDHVPVTPQARDPQSQPGEVRERRCAPPRKAGVSGHWALAQRRPGRSLHPLTVPPWLGDQRRPERQPAVVRASAPRRTQSRQPGVSAVSCCSRCDQFLNLASPFLSRLAPGSGL